MVYIIHSTNIENLIDILKINVLYANKYVKKSKWRMSGDEESQYIFTNLYVPKKDVPNFGPALIFSSDILDKESYIFNDRWVGDPCETSIFVHLDDTKKVKKYKLNKIKKIIKPKRIIDYEILFVAMIILKDYLVGILCPDCDKKTVNKIQKLLIKNKMEYVKVHTANNFKNIKL